MAKQYTLPEEEPMVVSESVVAYSHGVTIPINLPTTGGYSVEFLKKTLTDFAMKLLSNPSNAVAETHMNWHDITISDKVKSMTLGQSGMSEDTRSDKELLAEALEEKYR